MSRKIKFITTIICMLIILLVIAIGIWSALNINNLIWGNSVTFDSEAIEYSLTCKLDGNNEEDDNLGNKRYYSKEVTGYDSDTVAGIDAQNTWKLGKMTFVDQGEENAVVYTICVRNNSKDRNIYVSGFVVPNFIHSNLEIKYRMGYGIISGEYTWNNSLSDLKNCSTFHTYDETINANNIALNNSNDGLFVPHKSVNGEDTIYSYFMLEIKVVLVSRDISISHQDLNFSIGFYNQQQT